ncbi:Similar to GluRIA: Glutamate receptor 1 (Drosophila melanogaster) [Cotesia congregata]|uniref:Similar to GluRIA: Glutamate receptor 1 (Drosophila melanogaster) n=2 Tax=Cotesia TaxID=32390 RepID=A0A8J2H816_COTCN|nr:Similar to GluRIA: Glutamate receptor 1 (Drosophila melanogaster) [Cotesia congregata]
MLGAVSPDSFDTLHSYSNTFQMPFVTPWFPEKVLTPSSGFLDFAISMRPDYHRAIIDTVRHYGWRKIIYLYDSHDGESQSSYAFLILQVTLYTYFFFFIVVFLSFGLLDTFLCLFLSTSTSYRSYFSIQNYEVNLFFML